MYKWLDGRARSSVSATGATTTSVMSSSRKRGESCKTSVGSRPRRASYTKSSRHKQRRRCMNNATHEPTRLSSRAAVDRPNFTTSAVRLAKKSARSGGVRT